MFYWTAKSNVFRINAKITNLCKYLVTIVWNNSAKIKIHFYQQGNEKTKIKNKQGRKNVNEQKSTLNGEKQEKKKPKKTSNTCKNQMQKKQTQNTQIMNHIAITKTWMKMEGKKTKCEKKGKVAFYVIKMCKTHADVAG